MIHQSHPERAVRLSTLLLLGGSGELLREAWLRNAEPALLVKDTQAVRQLFGATSDMRLERGNALLALGGVAVERDERLAGNRADVRRLHAAVKAA